MTLQDKLSRRDNAKADANFIAPKRVESSVCLKSVDLVPYLTKKGAGDSQNTGLAIMKTVQYLQMYRVYPKLGSGLGRMETPTRFLQNDIEEFFLYDTKCAREKVRGYYFS